MRWCRLFGTSRVGLQGVVHVVSLVPQLQCEPHQHETVLSKSSSRTLHRRHGRSWAYDLSLICWSCKMKGVSSTCMIRLMAYSEQKLHDFLTNVGGYDRPRDTTARKSSRTPYCNLQSCVFWERNVRWYCFFVIWSVWKNVLIVLDIFMHGCTCLTQFFLSTVGKMYAGKIEMRLYVSDWRGSIDR